MKEKFWNKRNIIFFAGLVGYILLAVCLYFEQAMDIMNTTVFALHYGHGFLSRGVLGTFLQLWDQYSSVDLLSYHTVYQISEAATALYLILLLLFVFTVIRKVTVTYELQIKWISLILMFISVPMFLSRDNFGRLDVYLMILTLFCLILLMEEKGEWLIVPAVTFAAILHEGFVFMNLNIILVLLFYKILTRSEKKDKIKYGILFLLCFLLPSAFFLYFEFFSHTFGMGVYLEVKELAQRLSMDGGFHEQVLRHEILGEDIRGLEVEHHRWNREDLPVFLVLFLPYILLMIGFFRDYWKKNETVAEKWAALAVLAGPLTMLPEFILKVDYGRYVFAICFYYLAMVLVLFVLRDEKMMNNVVLWYQKIAKNKLAALMGILYLFLFLPFRGYRICDVVTTIVSIIFKN